VNEQVKKNLHMKICTQDSHEHLMSVWIVLKADTNRRLAMISFIP